MKKLLACVLVMMMLSAVAFAQGREVSGESVIMETEYEVEGLVDETSFALDLGLCTVEGTVDENGAITLHTSTAGDAAIKIGALPGLEMMQAVSAWMDSQGEDTAFANAVYSSLFTSALEVNVDSHTLAAALKTALDSTALGILLDADGALRAAADEMLSQPAQEACTLSRYKADERQFPNTMMLVADVYAENLPNIYLSVKTDEFGMTLTFAVETAEVTDWDETIASLENGSSTGYLVRAFTLKFDDEEELNVFAEVQIMLENAHYTIEWDEYTSHTGDYDWYVEALVSEETLGDMMELELETELSDENPQVDLSVYSTVYDLTDGVSDEEMSVLWPKQ